MLRLLLLYGLLCGLLLAGGLLLRSLRIDPWPLSHPVRATGLPFAGINIDTASIAVAADADRRRARMTELRAAGFEWVRLRFDWSALEPQPGVYDWPAVDGWIGDAVSAGLLPLVVLDGSPAWARAEQDRTPADNPLAPPANPADMAKFAAAFAGRYAGNVRYYQVWDEPNIAPHWGNRWVDPVAYAQLFNAVAPAIRAADPDAIVATAALAPTADRGHTAVDEVYFLQRMVAAGAGATFDAVAIQPLGFGYAPANPRQPPSVLDFQRALLIRRELVAMGLAGTPLWGVRFGWNREPNSLWGSVTPQVQAEYAVEALDLAWERWPWLEALGWAIDRPSAPPGDSRWGFALWAPNGAPAPVFAALQQWLASARTADRLSQPAATAAPPWLSWFLVAAGLVIVVWRGLAAARPLPWGQWQAGWRLLPLPLQLAGWAGLLLLYYFAVWPPLLGLCWLLWALLCLAQPRAGLVLAAMLLPFYFQHKDLYLVDAVIAVPPATAAVVCLLPAVIQRVGRRPGWFAGVDIVALAFLAISLLAAAHVWQWPAYRQGMLDLVLVPLALWFAFRILDHRLPGSPPLPGSPAGGFAYLVGLGLFAGGVAVAGWGLAAWLGGRGTEVDGVRRLVGPYFSPNHTALYLVRTLFLGIGVAACYTACTQRHRRSSAKHFMAILLWSATVLVLLALVLTGSRGALLLGLPAGGLVLAWAALRRGPGLLRRLAAHPVTRWMLGAVLLLAAAAVVLLWERLLNQQTLSLRIDLWEASLRLWRAHLLLGVGPGGFFWTYPAYLSPRASVEPNQLHPHNIWLEVATTWGLLGFAWLGLLLWHVAGARRRQVQPAFIDWLSAGLLAGLAAALAHAQMDAFFLLPDLAGWNALALAMLISRCEHPYSAG